MYSAYRSESCPENAGSSVLVSMFRAYTRDPPDFALAGATVAAGFAADDDAVVGADTGAAEGAAVGAAGATLGPQASESSAALAVPRNTSANCRRESCLRR